MIRLIHFFFSFKQAKRRDEILQLLRKQREERISVRLIGSSLVNLSERMICGKFSEVL
jgi:hypothetical protein